MKVVFVDLSDRLSDSHGIGSLIAVLKNTGVIPEYINSKNWNKICKEIDRFAFDLILYSAFSCEVEEYSRFDRFLKSRFKITNNRCQLVSLIGGPGPTYDPFFMTSGTTIDAACIGEGELALCDFIASTFKDGRNIVLNGRGADGHAFRKAMFVDLDSLPFPDRELIYNRNHLLRDMPSKQFLAGRGCPYDCSYCFNGTLKEMFSGCGPYVRKKSVEYLLEEIRYVKTRYGLKRVVFSDDTFVLGEKWLTEFCERFPKEIGLRYNCSVRPNLVTGDLVRMLKESGCAEVMWSIETGNENYRKTILQRNISDKDISSAADLMHKHGLSFRLGNMIGLPGESIKDMYDTIRMNINAKPRLGYTAIFMPYPGLKLTQYAIENGYYDSASQLPDNPFVCTLLNYSAKDKSRIIRIANLFPFLVRWPFLLRFKNVLEQTPFWLVRLVFKFYFSKQLSKGYFEKVNLLFSIRMVIRLFKRCI
ncbi:MAG: radical SAM protein [Kiritimatiellia bacterium]